MTPSSARPLVPLLLAACSASDGDDTAASDAYLAEANALVDEIEGQSYTPSNELPTGDAEYNGVIVLEETAGDEGVAGDLRLVVGFSDLDVGGSISNVVGSDGQAYAGSLDIGEDYNNAGGVDPLANQITTDMFSADFGGTLTAGGTDYLVDGNLSGKIAGANGEYAFGNAYAESCTAFVGCTEYDDSFYAEGGARP